jgi:hypothetical protein
LSDSHSSSARVIRRPVSSSFSEAETRMFQASRAFVSACQEATVAMHALTAKIREMEKTLEQDKRAKTKA